MGHHRRQPADHRDSCRFVHLQRCVSPHPRAGIRSGAHGARHRSSPRTATWPSRLRGASRSGSTARRRRWSAARGTIRNEYGECFIHEEHTASSWRRTRALDVGDRVELMPGYAPTTVELLRHLPCRRGRRGDRCVADHGPVRKRHLRRRPVTDVLSRATPRRRRGSAGRALRCARASTGRRDRDRGREQPRTGRDARCRSHSREPARGRRHAAPRSTMSDTND